MHEKINKRLILCTLVITSVLSGCQVVSVKEQALNVTLSNERDSILTRDKLSEASLNVLSMTGREAQICIDQPEECVKDLKKIPQILDEQLLSTASELYLANSLQNAKSAECNTSVLSKTQSQEKQQLQKQNIQKCLDQQLSMLDKSIRYSYAYLFKTERAPQDRIFDNRQVQIRDFYNLAIAHLIQRYAERYETKRSGQRIQVGNSVYSIDLENFPQLKNQPIEQLLSTYNMNFSGLRSITRRDGFGSEFLVVLPEQQPSEKDKKYVTDPLNHKYPNGINPNIHAARYLATTITAVPKSANSTEQILSTSEFHLKLYDPYKYEKIKVASKEYALAANFSAPYGLWLAENNLGRLAYLTLIDRDDSLSMPHLYMLEPYNPNKKILVLVHGLASSPEAWIRMTNDIMGDPVLRENFQVWQVFYSTNMPILESRFQINALVQQGFAQVANNAAAKKDAVLVGHSMGGVIARLMVSNADISQDAFKLVQNTRIEQFKDKPLFQARLQMQQIPNFSRAIFLATPHRGTEYANRWHTKLARKIIRVPGAFLGAFADTLQGEIGLKEFVKELGHDLIQNGPSDLSENSKFNVLTKNIQPYTGFKFHSIIGNTVDTTEPQLMSDGIVSYESAYLQGAVSSKVIKGGHSIQETPEAVLELRRILRLHLSDLGLYDPE
ncbi:esterase/lipase family protein [Acinetobacter pseudolwoffii]|uniref:esterase/lipase family protein n=1 Tax=Acinetobacter pseudolwoffii TaxID=2053287 RepID=UPI0025769814|nr:alpha/beta fold hydrolase [Acinetobacter pseudolwoffii]MDM1339929.1 alpha/beta fold hydrolase [Acinetobacter pseudolwoffii]